MQRAAGTAMLIGATIVELVLMLVVPVVLAQTLTTRLGTSRRVLLWGVATFVVSQALRWPVLTVLVRGLEGMTTPAWQFTAYVGVLGVTAGLFEECGRYMGYRLAIPDARRWADGVTYGLGHGIAEAVILGLGVALTLGTMLAVQEPSLSAEVRDYWSTPWFVAILGGLERLNTICVHMCLAVIVLRAVTSGHKRWLVLAVGLHAAFDAAAVATLATFGVVAAEMLIAAAATLALLALSRMQPAESQALTAAAGSM